MLVFIDESGDPGLKINQGSSRYFVVSMVVFEDYKEAEACDKRISLLGRELGYPEGFLFHFKDNSHKVRTAFLQAVAPYDFSYFGFVLNKDPQRLWGEGFKFKESLYKSTCSYIFENAKPYLRQAIVVIDKSGKKVFRSQLASYLKRKINDEPGQIIKKVKMQPDRGNNLLQLADYIAGIINRYQQRKRFSDEYRRFIAHKEIYVQVWPK
ncbi:MAG: DUF3800 domain-containing protein [Candidatus Omnitrophica bacterium]|nr:DUF3800 domain-containing protein [Candidatus Omnitrophota bacterium]